MSEELDLKLSEIELFSVPKRDWDTIISVYKREYKRRFDLSPLHCASIVDYVVKGIPPKSIFQSIGASYAYHYNKYNTLKEDIELLSTKTTLTEEEQLKFSMIQANPLYILMGDIERAEGASAIEDFTRFNHMAQINPELMVIKMKAKHRDVFGEKKEDSSVVNINIKLGGDFADQI